MKEIIGVRFRPNGKIYFFSPGDHDVECGQFVIVETARGVEFGKVVLGKRNIDDGKIVSTLKTIIRVATDEDKKKNEDNKEKSKKAFVICKEKIAKHKLDMKLIEAEYTFDNNKVLFYFTADGRIDFRELVKDLAAVFRTRIELRQIGVRDEAKMLGGLGICGRPFCCKTFLSEFQPVSIKMAKEQGLSLNPTKISGTCGRLMCCLKYEQDFYEEQMKVTPKIGAYVKTPDFKGYVEEANLLTGKLRVKPEKSDDPSVVFDKEDVKVIKDGRVKIDRDEIKALKQLEDK